jgi:hypothetical protein
MNRYAKEVWFANGFGLSIVCNENSYGGKGGLFEAGLLHKSAEGELVYAPNWGDVRGYLDFDGVSKLIAEVEGYGEDQMVGPMGGPYQSALVSKASN